MNPGDYAPDGTIYCGISPITGHPFFLLPKSLAEQPWKSAVVSAKKANALCYADWRLPHKEELQVLRKIKLPFGGVFWAGVPQYLGYGWIISIDGFESRMESKKNYHARLFVRGFDPIPDQEDRFSAIYDPLPYHRC